MRVIAATHQDMEKQVREGKFREDLYYRLNVVRIDLPPLRDRVEDIPVLVEHFCEKFVRPGQKPATVSAEAMDMLSKCPWPGNVRQLENAIERACVTARDGIIRVKDLPPDVGRRPKGQKKPVPRRPVAEAARPTRGTWSRSSRKRYIIRALRRTRGHVGKSPRLRGFPAEALPTRFRSTRSIRKNSK